MKLVVTKFYTPGVPGSQPKFCRNIFKMTPSTGGDQEERLASDKRELLAHVLPQILRRKTSV